MPDPDLAPARLFSLEGRTALVTGGSRGIGEAVAAGLLAAGARVLVAARDRHALDDATARLGPGCEALTADLSDVDGCRALAAAVAARTPALDVLVHSAGTIGFGPLGGADEAEWDGIMALNVRAVHYLTGALLGLLTARADADHPSRVVVVGSGTGLHPSGMPDHAYGASKAAVHMLVRTHAAELARRHVLVNGVAPGLFPTRLSAFLDDPTLRGPVLSTIPMGRAGRPEEVAGAVVFLASRAGGYVTGEVLAVDGGRAGIGRADPVAGL